MSYFELTGSLLSYNERQRLLNLDDPLVEDLYHQLQIAQDELAELESAIEPG